MKFFSFKSFQMWKEIFGMKFLKNLISSLFFSLPQKLINKRILFSFLNFIYYLFFFFSILKLTNTVTTWSNFYTLPLFHTHKNKKCTILIFFISHKVLFFTNSYKMIQICTKKTKQNNIMYSNLFTILLSCY